MFPADVAIVSSVSPTPEPPTHWNITKIRSARGAISIFDCQTGKLRRPLVTARGSALFLDPPRRGEQSADRRWCGSAAPMTRLAVGSISETLGDRRPVTVAGAPFGAPPRRSHYVGGPRFQQRFNRCRQPAPGRGSLCPRAE